jgi:hypothetical protein
VKNLAELKQIEFPAIRETGHPAGGFVTLIDALIVLFIYSRMVV